MEEGPLVDEDVWCGEVYQSLCLYQDVEARHQKKGVYVLSQSMSACMISNGNIVNSSS